MKRAPKRNLMLRMDAKLIDDLDRYCKNLNMSKSAFIQNMIKSVLEDAKTLFKGENLTFNDLYQLLASTAQKLGRIPSRWELKPRPIRRSEANLNA